MKKRFDKRIIMAGSKSVDLENARGRLVLLSAFFGIIFFICAIRLFDLSVIRGYGAEDRERHFRPEISQNQDQNKSIRADIVDRNGVLLARSLIMPSLYADPHFIEKPEETAQTLSRIFPDLEEKELYEDLKSSKRFVWIKRHLTPEEHEAVMVAGLPGLNIRKERKRIFPQGSLAAHVVGATSIDGQGIAGLEAFLENVLTTSQEPLVSSLDVRLQHILRREVIAAKERFSAKAGSGVILDVQSGEILAAASLPDFDPHLYARASEEQKFNHFSLGVYEMGSTFKIFSTAALLEFHSASMKQKFDAKEPLERGRFKIRDFHPEKRVLSLPEVFIYSSNIGSALMGEKVGSDLLKAFYEDLGLFHPVSFELPEQGKPLVPNTWRDINTLTASYGHGIAVSPVHVAGAIGSVINGGKLLKPTLLSQKNSHDYDQDTNRKQPEVQIVSEKTSMLMRKLMRLAVIEGTAVNADVPGYLVGGKTGTAEKPGVNGYDSDRLISSFAGVFPMNDPQYLVFVMIDEPQGIQDSFGYATGGWVAAPAVQKIIKSMVSVLGIEPIKQESDFGMNLVRYVVKEKKKEEGYAAH